MDILSDLGKEYKKRGGKNTPAEIIITGGAAILMQYSYRQSSYDVDAIIHASGAIKDAANAVAEKYGLAHDWLNSDFMRTTSYSKKLEQHSRYVATRSNILTIRVVDAEYLLATKLKSGREYKHDLSDIAGIIIEEKAKNPAFSKEDVINAFYDMYGMDSEIDDTVKSIMGEAFSTNEPEKLLERIKSEEQEATELLKDFEKDYNNVLNDENVHAILENIKAKKQIKSDNRIALEQETTTSN
jgi:predicted DNA-binding transcriptional regulator